MPVPIDSTLGMLGDNLRRRRSALPLSRRAASGWARELGLPRGGPTVLYTGQMWQMVPSIDAMSRRLAGYERSTGAGLFRWARRLNRIANLTPLLARPSRAERAAFDARLKDIARLLTAAQVEFGYLYEDDLYAGGLAHDEGLDAAAVRHARHVARVLERNGVRRAITVDPHTTNMLRSIYPKVVPGFAVEVKSYLEVLAERLPKVAKPLGVSATFHDSCLYARSEGVVAQPRLLLERGGVKLVEPEMSGRLTFCCGGPLEMLFPGKSQEVASRRLAQLRGFSPNVITACPLCLASLRRVAPGDTRVRDISEYLAESICPAPG